MSYSGQKEAEFNWLKKQRKNIDFEKSPFNAIFEGLFCSQPFWNKFTNITNISFLLEPLLTLIPNSLKM